MKVINQKNVYYIDPNKRIYRGYVETTVLRMISEKSLRYVSSNLDIEDVEILDGNISIEHKLLPERECCGGGSFGLFLPDSFKNEKFTVRIIFKSKAENPYVIWYKPINNKDKHAELLGLNVEGHVFPHMNAICEFELVYIIPNVENLRIVSSGAFHAIKEEENNSIYIYKTVANPCDLGFSVGIFNEHDIFTENSPRKFYTPVKDVDVSDVVFDLQNIIKYIENFCKTDSLKNMNVLFTAIDVDYLCLNSYVPEFDCRVGTNMFDNKSEYGNVLESGDQLVWRNITILPYSMLSGGRDVEINYVFKRMACDLLALNVFKFLNLNIMDWWIMYGLSGYLADLCYRNLLGNNEFLYTYKEDKDYVIKNDVVAAPLFYTKRKPVEYQYRFFKTKSKLVFHCLKSYLSMAFLEKIADEIIMRMNYVNSNLTGCVGGSMNCNNNCVDNMGDISENQQEDIQKRAVRGNYEHAGGEYLITLLLVDIIKNQSGKDLTSFFDFYVFKPGLIHVKLKFQINKKKSEVRVEMTQNPTSVLPGCNRKYTGSIALKTQEIEGSFDHELFYEAENVFYYHTRTKKKKKEDEEDVMSLLFMKMDPKRKCLFNFIVHQPDYMYIEQLNDKNLIGQVEAIDALSLKPSVATCNSLERILDNAHVFYKVRIKIMYTLRSIYLEKYNGMQRLIQYFIRTRCVPNSTIIKGNEFGLQNYFIQKHLVHAICLNRFHKLYHFFNSYRSEKETIHREIGREAYGSKYNQNSSYKDGLNFSIKHGFGCNFVDEEIIIAFLEHILKFNDNSLSQFDDSWYLALVIHCMTFYILNFLLLNNSSSGKIVVLDLFRKCLNEVERFRVLDMVFSSNNNIITRSALFSLILLAAFQLISIDKTVLFNIARYPNLYSIRLAAIRGILILYNADVLEIFDIVEADTPFFLISVLNVFLKYFNHWPHYSFDLGEFRTRLCVLYRTHRTNLILRELACQILLQLDGKALTLDEYKKTQIKSYDAVQEEAMRAILLSTPKSIIKIKIVPFGDFKKTILKSRGVVKIPMCKKPSVQRIRIKRLKRVPPIVNSMKFKLKRVALIDNQNKVIEMLKRNISEHFGYGIINDFINKWSGDDVIKPLTFKKIFEKYKNLKIENKISIDYLGIKGEYIKIENENIKIYSIINNDNKNSLKFSSMIEDIEKTLIFILTHTNIKTKIYSAAKIIFNLVERILFQYYRIQPFFCLMSNEIRTKCNEFITQLRSNPNFEVFYYKVNCNNYRNYSIITRVSVCFDDIIAKIPLYTSYDAFIFDIERIYKNCLSYNRRGSDISHTALDLKQAIDTFKEEMAAPGYSLLDSHSETSHTPLIKFAKTSETLKNIVKLNDPENLLGSFYEEIDSCRSWSDLERSLARFKSKYSRYSVKENNYVFAIID